MAPLRLRAEALLGAARPAGTSANWPDQCWPGGTTGTVRPSPFAVEEMSPRCPFLLAADSPGPGKLWTKAPVFGKPLATGFCTPSATPMSWALAKAADVPPMIIITARAEAAAFRVYLIKPILSLLV